MARDGVLLVGGTGISVCAEREASRRERERERERETPGRGRERERERERQRGRESECYLFRSLSRSFALSLSLASSAVLPVEDTGIGVCADACAERKAHGIEMKKSWNAGREIERGR